MMKDTAEVKGKASADADAGEDAGSTFGLLSGLAKGYGIDCHSQADNKIFLLPHSFARFLWCIWFCLWCFGVV